MKRITDELRDLSKSCKYYYTQPIILGRPLSDYFVDLARRIDKKHGEEIKSLQSTIRKLNDAIAEKQELNANSKSAQIEFYNVAKLREELDLLLGWATSCLQMPQDKRTESLKVGADFVKTCCEDALKEPPRNCDMFGGDYKMLHTAWFDWTGSPSGRNDDGTVKMTFSEWLLATAEKGGAK